MPEFDTYNAIERYAKDNSNPEAYLSYKFLKRRTQNMLLWRVMSSGLNPEPALQLYMGLRSAKAGKAFVDMSEAERQALYNAALKETGIQLDPTSFKNK